ncbi:hypothetical protein ACE3MZ_06735 [Paenibacillus sp. WLX1005]|uniref:hypothetical protein n=1 Tax=Paenibacillus sp. WLX1005 TaxID=3243766 RepID=UPI00398439AC
MPINVGAFLFLMRTTNRQVQAKSSQVITIDTVGVGVGVGVGVARALNKNSQSG